MPLDITLSDLTWRWQLKDDQATEDWFSRRPWLRDGGVVVIQATDDGDVTIGALEQEVYRADRGASEVRVVRLGLGAGDFNEAVGDWLNIARRKPRDLALALADDLQARPAIFLIDARCAPMRNSWADEASALWDMASKLEMEKKPSVIILHLRGKAPLRGRYILDRGWPVGLALSLLGPNDERLWSRYVHLRFAWESGGVIEDAIDCAAIADGLPLQNDDDLERVLNHFATAKFLLLVNDERRAWVQYVDSPTNLAPTVFGYAEELEGRLTAFPWLARALLLHGAVHPNTARALRQEMLCRPIAEQVLNRCFAVEASLRRRLPSSLPEAPADLRVRYERFLAKGTRRPMLEVELYPSGHPYPPADPWDFASVGLVAKQVTVASDQQDRLERMKFLRNAAAHCHYMGWKGVMEARALRALLA